MAMNKIFHSNVDVTVAMRSQKLLLASAIKLYTCVSNKLPQIIQLVS